MEDLFTQAAARRAPLADRMRPRTLDDFYGQDHLVGPGRLLRRAIQADRMTSSIFYGPPGCGKTTLASILAETTSSAFVKLNAVTTGVAEVREVLEEARKRQSHYGKSTYLLLDECHRWSKAQSDSILPAVEKGIICFIGSTTENPMISMTPALVSRCRIFQFFPLSEEHIKRAVRRALSDEENGLGRMRTDFSTEALDHIAYVANGDVRSALNAVELAVLTTPPSPDGVIHIDLPIAEESIQQRVLQMDESYFYDMLSAFCKCLRGSDPDAALSWYARMIHGGVDPRIIVRRLIAHASEDIGLACPDAMVQAVTAGQALEMVGMPEAGLSLCQAICFLCSCPKSNAIVAAKDASMKDAAELPHSAVPLHLQDTSYKGSERIRAGEGYRYPHNYPGHYIFQEYAPRESEGKTYYEPSDQGFEVQIRQWRKEREETGRQNAIDYPPPGGKKEGKHQA